MSSQPTRQNLYRKYRPQTFSELLGQEHIVRTLQSAVSTGRLAHAYMFSGPRGTGKTSAARLLAKILNCRQPVTLANGMKDACRTCDVCRRIEDLTFMDIVEIDAASNNGVDDIRQMREKVKYLPVEGQYKIYIIDEVHMLSGAAFNAFLKTLEEPPPRVVFVLATTDPQKVPATILSRCQCFDFHAISRKIIVERLTEVALKEREADPQNFPEIGQEALYLIAECAAGGFRDALSLLDQITGSMSGGIVTLDMVLEMTRRLGHAVLRQIAQCLFTKDAAGLLNKLHELFFRGHETLTIGRDLLEYLRRCLVLKIDPKAGPVLEIPVEQAQDITAQVTGIGAELLMAMAVRLERVVWSLRSSAYPRLLLEIELVRLAMGEVSAGTEGLERRVAAVESRLMGGALPPAVGAPASPAGRAPITPASPGLRALPGGAGRTEPPKKPASAPTPLRPVPEDGDLPAPESAPRSNSPASLFQAFQARFMKVSRVNGAFLQQATFGSFKDGVVTAVTTSGFHLERLREPAVQSQMEPLLAELFGPGTTFVIKYPQDLSSRQTPATGAPAPASNAPEAPAGANHAKQIARIDQEARNKVIAKPSVADALELFGGDVVNVERGNGSDPSGEEPSA
ncbi:MAG TPA: DNA polymerase III subunit gamma/tau [Candidatus Ozemobacteraceae bacterium]|nr:DNA polymerase III subunit gamma/tau [Candidatus Ozemobacteraceae bacterium]